MKTPFNMIILSLTNCGKTYYLLKMLEKEYFQHFEYIYLICPTYEWNKTYQNWKYNNDPDFFAIPCSHNDVDKYLKSVTGNTLIIIDDCAISQSVKTRTSELVNLAFCARHSMVSAQSSLCNN